MAGHGITEIPVAERTAYGDVVKGDTIIECLKVKAAKPLASYGLIAELTGLSHSTVSAALSTPYAQKHLASMPTGLPLLASKLHDTQADGVEYYQKSVSVGIKALEDPSTAPAHILTNTREVLAQVGKATGLLKDTLRLESKVESELDYSPLADLSPDLEVLTSAVLEGSPSIEGQVPTSTPQAVNEQGNNEVECQEQGEGKVGCTGVPSR